MQRGQNPHQVVQKVLDTKILGRWQALFEI